MDKFTEKHLDNWLLNTQAEESIEGMKSMITSFVNDYPELLNDHSWPEIERMVLRS